MMETCTLVRLGIFLVVFDVLAEEEILLHTRPTSTSKSRRWFTNLTIITLNPLAVTVIFPILPVGLALLAAGKNWGLLNQFVLP